MQLDTAYIDDHPQLMDYREQEREVEKLARLIAEINAHGRIPIPSEAPVQVGAAMAQPAKFHLRHAWTFGPPGTDKKPGPPWPPLLAVRTLHQP